MLKTKEKYEEMKIHCFIQSQERKWKMENWMKSLDGKGKTTDTEKDKKKIQNDKYC